MTYLHLKDGTASSHSMITTTHAKSAATGHAQKATNTSYTSVRTTPQPSRGSDDARRNENNWGDPWRHPCFTVSASHIGTAQLLSRWGILTSNAVSMMHWLCSISVKKKKKSLPLQFKWKLIKRNPSNAAISIRVSNNRDTITGYWRPWCIIVALYIMLQDYLRHYKRISYSPLSNLNPLRYFKVCCGPSTWRPCSVVAAPGGRWGGKGGWRQGLVLQDTKKKVRHPGS